MSRLLLRRSLLRQRLNWMLVGRACVSIGVCCGSASTGGRGGCPGVMGVAANGRETPGGCASHGRGLTGGGGCTGVEPILGGSLSE